MADRPTPRDAAITEWPAAHSDAHELVINTLAQRRPLNPEEAVRMAVIICGRSQAHAAIACKTTQQAIFRCLRRGRATPNLAPAMEEETRRRGNPIYMHELLPDCFPVPADGSVQAEQFTVDEKAVLGGAVIDALRAQGFRVLK